MNPHTVFVVTDVFSTIKYTKFLNSRPAVHDNLTTSNGVMVPLHNIKHNSVIKVVNPFFVQAGAKEQLINQSIGHDD